MKRPFHRFVSLLSAAFFLSGAFLWLGEAPAPAQSPGMAFDLQYPERAYPGNSPTQRLLTYTDGSRDVKFKLIDISFPPSIVLDGSVTTSTSTSLKLNGLYSFTFGTGATGDFSLGVYSGSYSRYAEPAPDDMKGFTLKLTALSSVPKVPFNLVLHPSALTYVLYPNTAYSTAGAYTYQKTSSGSGGLLNLASAGSYTLAWKSATAGVYVVPNGAGQIETGTFMLTEQRLVPKITSQTTSVTAPTGGSVSLSASATGTPPLAYQWKKNGAVLSGGTSSTFALSPASKIDAGTFELTVTNEFGDAKSTPIVLRVLDPPRITLQPQSGSAAAASPFTFTTTASGDAPLSYQWKKGGSNLLGGTLSTLNFASVSTLNEGSYTVVVSNPVGSVTSAPAILTIRVPPQISAPLLGGSVNVGASVAFGVTPSGSGAFSYAWKRNGETIPGATGPTLLLPLVGALDAGSYEVSVSSNGLTTKSTAVLNVNTPVTIVRQPADTALRMPANGVLFVPFRLTVNALGTPPLSYQWRRQGVAIPGGTLSSFPPTGASLSEAGTYDVIVTNPFGSVLSQAAVVSPPLTIIRGPTSTSVREGSALTLSVQAVGAGTLAYQWFKDASALPGETNPSLQVSTASPAAATGDYSVEVSDALGSQTSTAASVNVLPASTADTLAWVTEPAPMSAIKGFATFLPVEVSAEPNTQYTLWTMKSGTLAPTTISGSVSASGKFTLPLRSLAASAADYVLKVTRTGSGTLLSASQPFQVTLRSWDEAAGAYEVLLPAKPGTIADDAMFRGLLTLTVNPRGALSGRLSYNEAPPLADAGTANLRSYTPVTYSFSGAFAPSLGDPLKASFRKTLGTAAAVHGDLSLEMNFGTSPPTLKATVSDRFSDGPANVHDIGVEGCTRLSAQAIPTLPPHLAGLAGYYCLSSSPDADQPAFLLLQVTPSGKVLWRGRSASYPNPGFYTSGAAYLNPSDPLKPAAELYSDDKTSSAQLLSTNSLLGRVLFQPQFDGSWGAILEGGTLEQQSSRLSKRAATPGSSMTVPYYDAVKFRDSTNWSNVVPFPFSGGNGTRWSGGLGDASPPPFPPGTQLRLRLDMPAPLPSNPPKTLFWNVTISNTGQVTSSGSLYAGSTPSSLSLLLNKTSGAYSGSYLDSKVGLREFRPVLYGVAQRASAGTFSYGRGWAEIGGTSGEWSLELAR